MTILKSNNSSEKLAESSKTVKLTVTVYYRKGTQVTISTREQYTGRARRVQGVSFQMSSSRGAVRQHPFAPATLCGSQGSQGDGLSPWVWFVLGIILVCTWMHGELV